MLDLRSPVFGSWTLALRAPVSVLIGLTILLVGLTGPASAAPSHWEPVEDEFSEEFEACPGVDVLWELTVTGKSRFTTRGRNGLPLYQEHVTDTEVYTNLANGEWVRVVSTRTEHPLSVTNNGDGTLTYLYNHTGKSTMYAADGSVVARLGTGGVRIEKTFAHHGTPYNPDNFELVGLNFPDGFGSTGRSDADFCTALVGAIG
jgi:hypothetical protein